MSLETRIVELAQAVGADIKDIQLFNSGGAVATVAGTAPVGKPDGHLWLDTGTSLEFANLYELAVANGFVGTIEDYLLSINAGGIPEGGTDGQILVKVGSSNFTVAWANASITGDQIIDGGELTLEVGLSFTFDGAAYTPSSTFTFGV